MIESLELLRTRLKANPRIVKQMLGSANLHKFIRAFEGEDRLAKLEATGELGQVEVARLAGMEGIAYD